MIVGLSIFMTVAFLLTIASLLRQLNKEREERFVLMNHYANLALRVRWSQAVTEEPLGTKMDSLNPPWEAFENPSSVQEVEGKL